MSDEPREDGVCYYSRIIKTESGVQDTFFDGKVYTIVKREDLKLLFEHWDFNRFPAQWANERDNKERDRIKEEYNL